MTRPRLAVIGAIAALVVLAALSWFFLLSPRIQESAKLQEEATQTETANLSLRNQYNTMRGLVEDAPRAAAEAQALFEQMPRTADLPAVLEQINAAALEAGIEPAQVQSVNASVPVAVAVPGTESAGVQLAQLTLNMAATGKPASLLRFVDALQNLDRLMLINSTQWSQGQAADAKEKSIQIQGQMFVLASDLPDLVAQVDELIASAEASAAG